MFRKLNDELLLNSVARCMSHMFDVLSAENFAVKIVPQNCATI